MAFVCDLVFVSLFPIRMHKVAQIKLQDVYITHIDSQMICELTSKSNYHCCLPSELILI